MAGLLRRGDPQGGKSKPRRRHGRRSLAVMRDPRRVHRPQRSKLRGQFWMEHLEDALRVLEIPQAVHAERLERHARRQLVSKRISRGAGEQDLASVAGVDQAGHAAQRRPEVVAVAPLGVAGVEGHPHLQLRNADRIGCTAERPV